MGFDRALDDAPVKTARAYRYSLGTRLWYRVRGEKEWRDGVMENISTSGVFIRAAQALELNTVIEMRFILPVELNEESAAEVFCRGSVVRSSGLTEPAGGVGVAARIMHSRFLRQMGKPEFVGN